MNRDEITQIVLSELQEKLETPCSAETLEIPFTQLEVDSLSTVDLIVRCMKKTNLKIQRNQYQNIKSGKELVDYFVNTLKT